MRAVWVWHPIALGHYGTNLLQRDLAPLHLCCRQKLSFGLVLVGTGLAQHQIRFDALCVAIGADPLLKQLLSILEGDANDNILKYSETSVAAYPTFFGGKLQTTRKRSKEMDSLFRNYIFFSLVGGGR